MTNKKLQILLLKLIYSPNILESSKLSKVSMEFKLSRRHEKSSNSQCHLGLYGIFGQQELLFNPCVGCNVKYHFIWNRRGNKIYKKHGELIYIRCS